MPKLEELLSTSEGFMELLTLVVQRKDSSFLSRDLFYKEDGEEYYFSYHALRWVEETYYLFEKIEKKDDLIFEIMDILSLAKACATVSLINSLDPKIELFLKNKDKYSIKL